MLSCCSCCCWKGIFVDLSSPIAGIPRLFIARRRSAVSSLRCSRGKGDTNGAERHGLDAGRAGAGQDAGGHGGRRGVRAAATRGAVLLRRHQPPLHPQHHPGKQHGSLSPTPCLRADLAADLALRLFSCSGIGAELRSKSR